MNPTAGADTAQKYRSEVQAGLREHFPSATVEFISTTSSADPARIGEQASDGLLLCVSGDGTVHGVLQGLMRRDPATRPALSVLPVGSGNDIARSFAIPSSPALALPALAAGRLARTDVGRCICDGASVHYFLETMSFGVDAAVALKTVALRKKTRQREAWLYARAALDAILHELHVNHFRYRLDDTDYTDDLLIMAIQNGPTYGGGFRVAPAARLDDGVLNICTATKVSTLTALYYLSQMKTGAHERLSRIHSTTARRLLVETDHPVPAQMDGEPCPATRYEIDLLPQCLDFLAPQDSGAFG